MTVRAVLFGAIVLGLLLGSAIVSLRALNDDTRATTGVGTTPDDEAEPTATAPAGSPRDTAERFAAAWVSGDFTALYALLSPEAQAAITESAFIDTYRNFSIETTERAMTAEVVDADPSLASVAISLSTRYFDTLDYTVSLTLVETPEGLRVAWHPSAMHPQLQTGQRIISTVAKPDRGAIYDRNGEPLAQTLSTEMMGLNRSIIDDEAAVIAALEELGYTRDVIDAALASPLGANQRVPIGPVPADLLEAAVLAQRGTPGLLIYFEESRVHPLGAAAAHVVGYTRELTAEELEARTGSGYGPGDRVGASGLEASMDAVLAGTPGGQLQVVDAGDNVIHVLAERPFAQGRDVHTTLDAGVLRAVQARLGDRNGAMVVMDPRTNEILAVNSNPSYDPDAFERGDSEALEAIFADEDQPLLNRAFNGVYSAGSTFKLITGAAGLVYGGLSTGDRLDCPALWTVIDPPRRNWEGAQGLLTIADALRRSCNPVFYQIGYDLYFDVEEDALSEMARMFGFGAASGATGIDDDAGLVPDSEWKQSTLGEAWFAGDNVNLAIGQGALLVTPLQLANAYSTFLANTLRAPVIVQGEEATPRGTLPLDEAQRDHLLSGLKAVTQPGGTAGYAFASQGYTNFGGKSGTAEDANAQQHVLFVAFAPADDPVAVAAVILDDGDSGSLEAGPIARDAVLAAMGQ